MHVCICTYVLYVQWLLCLQRIESLAGRCFSLRASCGVYLKRTGTLKRAMDLFMNLVPNLVKQRYVSILTSLCPTSLTSPPSYPPFLLLPPSLIPSLSLLLLLLPSQPPSFPPSLSPPFSPYYYLRPIPFTIPRAPSSLILHTASCSSIIYFLILIHFFFLCSFIPALLLSLFFSSM